MLKRAASYFAFVLFLYGLLLLSRCAQIVIPGGGKKDSAAPKVLKYTPDSNAVHFKGNEIEMVFDELIQLSDMQKNFTVSPPLKYLPEIKVKGRVLSIELKDTLMPNTTYCMDFGNAIQDIRENNPKRNFKYVFSTGPVIDTLSLRGTVKNAFDHKPEKGILVMLFNDDESAPGKKPPLFYTRTRDDGTYQVTNIRPGTYRVFALRDANANYLYDMPTESIGFSDTAVGFRKDVSLDLRLFREEPAKQKLLKASPAGFSSFLLIYARPVQELNFKPLRNGTPTGSFLKEFNTGRDSIRLWFPQLMTDSMIFQSIADGENIDTIRTAPALFQKSTGGRGEALKFSVSPQIPKDALLDLNKNLVLRFNHPVRKEDMQIEKIGLRSASGAKSEWTAVYPDSAVGFHRRIELRSAWAGDSTYLLFIPPGTFKNIFGMSSDTVKVSFKVQEEKYYGTLKLNLRMKYRIAFILDLISEKGEIYHYVSSDKSIFEYEFLPPGNYRVRVIYDKNGDGKWTPGNYSRKKQPETVIYYPGTLTIRSNWDLEQEWSINE